MKRLLVIEDDERFVAGLVRSLSRRDYSCMIASSVEDARKLCRSFHPQHILMDLNLGAENTQEYVSQLRNLCPTATIVMLTGYGTIPSAVQAIRDGADSYLTKPASPDAIDKALAEKRSQEKLTPLWEVENHHILQVLEKCGGNITHAAKKLGLHRRTLQRRLKQL